MPPINHRLDRSDLKFALEQGVDWIALSFVQRPEDVAEARALIGDKAALLAKIEKPAAIAELDAIVELADAVMVARGDLGVELPPEDVPPAQNRIAANGPSSGRYSPRAWSLSCTGSRRVRCAAELRPGMP